MIDELEALAKRAKKISDDMGWDRTWIEIGCYLHLETSEYIEALRGKGESTPAEEAADIIFVLLSSLPANNITVKEVMDWLEVKMKSVELKAEEKKYKKEYWSY